MSARTRGATLAAALTAAALTALPLAAVAVTPASPLPGAPADPLRSAIQAEAAAEAVTDVAITSISPQVLTPDETLTVIARVHNATPEEIEEPVVRLYVNRFRVVDREGVAAWADLTPADSPGSVIETRVLEAPLPAGATRDVRFQVPGRNLGFLDLPDTWGPRGLAVSVAESPAVGVSDVDRSFVLWQSAPSVPRTRLSVIVPLTGDPVDVPQEAGTGEAAPGADGETPAGDASPEATPDATQTSATSPGSTGTGTSVTAGVLGTETIAPLTSPQGRLGAVLAATSTRSHVAFALDPAVVAASKASTDPTAQAWTASLLASLDGRDLFALGWADPDVAALARGDGASLLTGALRLTDERIHDVLGRAPRTDLAWPAGGLADAQTLELVASTGARAAVGAPGVLAPSPDGREQSPTGRTTVTTDSGSVVVLLPDAGLVGALVNPQGSTPATVAQRLLAETAVISQEESADLRHLVVALPREWHPNPVLAGAQLDALEVAPWVDTTSVSALLGALDPAVDRVALPTDVQDRDMLDAETVSELAERFAFAQDFAPVLTDPEAFLAKQAAQLLAPTSVAWRADPDGRADLAARVTAEAEARTVGLTVVEGSDVSFFAREGS
ncbi:MAG: hypothetical protein GX593_05030, partial [Actinomycetales bacterium]|nr:hypothetical protein [Actinomycetales bacterium]